VPTLKQKFSEATQGLRTLVGSKVLGVSGKREAQVQELRRAEQQMEKQREQIARQNQELEELRAALDGSSKARGVRPENIVWIFGSGRSGSTWLSSMIGDLSGQTLWGEPWVGYLFGYFYYTRGEGRHQSPQFILGRHRESWIRSIRNFILDATAATFPHLDKNDYLVIKEPNGSVGAPLMMEALPESRMILLVRDPRDVVASFADARREGGWHYEKNRGRPQKEWWMLSPDDDPASFAEERATALLRQLGNAKEAYDAHDGPKVLVRYEELRADALGTMRRVYSTLGVTVDERELERVVEKHSWENISEDEKGEGKFYRKGKPGGWKEDLTPEQIEVVERITAPLLKEYYFYGG
jgi:Sulfotransferase domain